MQLLVRGVHWCVRNLDYHWCWYWLVAYLVLSRYLISWTNVGLLLMGPFGAIVSEICIPMHQFSFLKMYSNMSSAKWSPSCLSLNVLKKKLARIIKTTWHFEGWIRYGTMQAPCPKWRLTRQICIHGENRCFIIPIIMICCLIYPIS